jgi:hypothetical protein
MAEQLVLVCDVCGQPASETITIRAGSRSLLKDLCAKHLGELLTGTRVPKRGRPKSTRAASRSRSTSGAKRTARRSEPTTSRSKRRRGKGATRAVATE